MQLKQMVIEYEAPKTMNICDLDKVSLTDCNVTTKEYNKEDGTSYTIDVITIEDQEYRIPKSVIAQCQTILNEKDDFDLFKVSRSGTGMNTKYTVIPL